MTALDPFLRLLFWGAFYVGAARIGAWLTGSSLRGLAHLAWDGLAGLPVLIAGCLAVGLLRFDRITIAAFYALLLAITLVRTHRDPVVRFPRRADLPTWIAIGGLVILGGIGLFWNRVPVLFYDSLAYHFAQPDLWLLEGRIAPADWSLHSWFPPGMSVLYGVGLAFGGEAWANDANLMVGLALCLLLFDLARRSWNSSAGLVALIALLSVPQMLFALSIPAADLAHGTFVAGALGALFLARLEPHRDWTRHAAWITAGALLTKYLGLLVPLVAGAVFLLLDTSRSAVYSQRPRAALVFCAPALCLLLPWLVANSVVVGNPLAPMFSSVLAVDGLAPDGTLSFTRDARGGLPGPADLRALGPRLFGAPNAGIYPGPAWGWPVAVWLVGAALAAVIDRRVRHALGVAAALFTIWFVTFRWERFLIATTFFACLALAGTVWLSARRTRVWRLLAVAALLAGLAYTPASLATIARYSGGVDVFFGRESREDFLHRSWPQQRLVEHGSVVWNAKTDRLLLVGEMRHYRLPVRRVAPTGFNRHPLATALERSVAVEQVHDALRRQGFSHLLIDFDRIDVSARDYPSLRPLAEAREKFAAYVRSLGTPLVSDGRRSLFRIPDIP